MSNIVLGKKFIDGETAIVEMDDTGHLVFPGYDIETDLSLEELGFGKTDHLVMLDGYDNNPVELLIEYFWPHPDVICKIAIEWMKKSLIFDAPGAGDGEIYEYENKRQYATHFIDIAQKTCSGKYVSPGSTYTAESDAYQIATVMRRTSQPMWSYASMEAFEQLMKIVNATLPLYLLGGEDPGASSRNRNAQKALCYMSFTLFEADEDRYSLEFAAEASLRRMRVAAELLSDRRRSVL